MNEEKWAEFTDNLRDRFEIIEDTEESDNITDDIGHEVKGKKQIIVFVGPQGKMMVTRTSRPAIIDKKSHYHKTQGGGALTEFVVSDTEMTNKVAVYTWSKSSGDWQEINLKSDKLTF
jgi:hypothetical protein